VYLCVCVFAQGSGHEKMGWLVCVVVVSLQ